MACKHHYWKGNQTPDLRLPIRSALIKGNYVSQLVRLAARKHKQQIEAYLKMMKEQGFDMDDEDEDLSSDQIRCVAVLPLTNIHHDK